MNDHSSVHSEVVVDYLKSKNVPKTENWTQLTIATAITTEGKVVGGSGIHNAFLGDASFIMTLP